MKNSVNAEMHAFSELPYLEKKLVSQRRKLFDAFIEFKGQSKSETILDVSILPTGPLTKGSGLKDWIGASEQPFVKACSILVSPDHSWRPAQAEPASAEEHGTQTLAFANEQFDWVFCNEVLEHVGTYEHQLNLLRELTRIARKGAFVTTQNKRHPIEFNTGLPLLHWLPKPFWNTSLKLLGKGEWASKELLNPIGSDTLKAMTAALPNIATGDIGHLRVAGIKAHFFLMLRKKGSPQHAMR